MQFFIAFLLITFVFSCQGESSEDNEMTDSKNHANDNSASEVEEKAATYYVAIVNDLRVRESPSIKAKVVATMAYDQRALYLNEESDFKEKITLRGKNSYDSWKKIKLNFENNSKSIIGWAYGGGLIKESEIYKSAAFGVMEREIHRATNEEISDLLRLKIEEDFFFDGIIRYKKNDQGYLVEDGNFKLSSPEKDKTSKELPTDLQIDVTGSYKMGVPDGLFELKLRGLENTGITTVYYKEGKCLWSSHVESSGEQDHSFREELPKDCSFRYIQEKWAEQHSEE